MKKSVKELLVYIFGNKPKIVFKRIMILMITIIFGFILIQNVGCKFKIGDFEFNWNQAADIKIEK